MAEEYKIRLDMFEGPLDLLLYLIKKEELDITDIPITRITEQYLEYLNLMEVMDLEIAGEFLVMAATLMQIKSKMLLPPDPDGAPEEESDPRAELVRRLLEYKAFKEAAEKLKGFEDERGRFFGRVGVEPEYEDGEGFVGEVSIFDLLSALQKVLKDIPVQSFHEINKDEFTVADKMQEITFRLSAEPTIYFSRIFRAAKNKFEVITTFIALLELIRRDQIRIRQTEFFGEIEIARKVQTATALGQA